MIGTTYRKLIDIRKQHKASQQILMVYATKPTNVFFCAGLIQIRCCTFYRRFLFFLNGPTFFANGEHITVYIHVYILRTQKFCMYVVPLHIKQSEKKINTK